MESPRPYSLKKDLSRAAVIALLPFWLFAPCFWFMVLGDLPPKFSVHLAGARGLDAPISTAAFNITLHAANRRQTERCYRHGEAVVRYSGFVLAWGRTRAFCVGGGEVRDVLVVAHDDGVRAPRLLLERMAADQGAGAVDLEVNVRLFRGDDGSARPTWMSCKVMAGVAAPPDVTFTPCTMFALQNWASDIAPDWMQ
ncbi:hypothetical protein ACP70R_036906 [Stipagrostis hirtigluma subsp. patula]